MHIAFLVAVAAYGPYTDLNVEGWTVRVELAALKDQRWRSAKEELSVQLYRIRKVVPDGPLANLRKVKIWVHRNSPATKCMAYHPGPEWLREHGVNPEMAKGIEVANLENFLSWTHEQPWMVLHELAHAYHFQFLQNGHENKEVLAVWTARMETKTYDSVLHWDGKTTKHYGTNNQMEYFAECSEAYFGRNDFYPFVRAELLTFDPEGHKLMESIWGRPQKRL